MITLPSWVDTQTATPRLVDRGIWNEPFLGGSFTRTDRPGSRFACEFTLPPIWSDDQGKALLADLIAAKRQGMRYRWPLGALGSSPVGSPRVVGNTNQGTTLLVRGFTPLINIKKGQFFSLTHEGKSYLHVVHVGGNVSAGGNAAVTIEPELRVIPSDNDVIEFERPIIEGIVKGSELVWTQSVNKYMEFSFTLEEMQ